MPRRIVHVNKKRSGHYNKKNPSRRHFSKKITLAPKKNTISDILHKIALYIENNINIKGILVTKNTLLMSTTVLISCFLGYSTLNNILETEKQVSAIEQPVLPERQLPGVSKAGHQYADDATKVMKKLQEGNYSNDGKKVVYLTFDDGPSSNTSKILDILEKNDIKATFFISGKSIEYTGEKAKELLQRSYNYGNAIANHSYSHDYNVLYPNKTLDLDAFIEDFEKTEKLLSNILGKNFKTRVLRCPGGQMSWQGMDSLKSYLNKTSKASIDWNSLSSSEFSKSATAKDLYNEVVETSEGKEMVVLLMHDASSKVETVKSLQSIINYYKQNGYEFRTLI